MPAPALRPSQAHCSLQPPYKVMLFCHILQKGETEAPTPQTGGEEPGAPQHNSRPDPRRTPSLHPVPLLLGLEDRLGAFYTLASASLCIKWGDGGTHLTGRASNKWLFLREWQGRREAMLVAPARACGLHLGASRPLAHLEMLCLCGFMQKGTEGGGGGGC